MKANGEFEWNQLRIAFRKARIVHVGLLLLCLVIQSPAQMYKILHTFGTNVMGQYPYSTLVQGPDGALYGTTEQGGSANRGQVFKVKPDGTGYTVLKDFTGIDGAWPEAGLVLEGTTLYGTTANGDTNDNGVVFKVKTDGTGFAVLHRFTWADGANPWAKLALSGTMLYGTTFDGGAAGSGTIFKLNTDGSDFTVLKHFAGSPDAAGPWAGLVVSGGTLYGTASGGGNSGNGVVFKINTDGSGYTALMQFHYNDGSGPCADLLLSGTTLYGTTTWGGNSGGGTVFKLGTNGSAFAVLKDFTNYYVEGANPGTELVLSGATLYGATPNGGVSNYGTVFKLDIDGSGFAVLKDFANAADGVSCQAGLLLLGSTLFGTTFYGGAYGYGNVFELQTDGSGFTVLTNFVGGDAANPNGGLLLSGTNLYGVTWAGGAAGLGTLFRANPDGNGYTIVKDFTNSVEGAGPAGSLVLSDTTLYGATFIGGSAGNGVLFKVDTDGSGYTVLKDFTNQFDGANPNGGLVVFGDTLYGTATWGGSNDCGVVFKINTDGSAFALLHTFSVANWSGGENSTNEDGVYPEPGLVLSGTTLYGTAWGGGTNGLGTLFRVHTDGTGFSVIRNFAEDDVSRPGGLVLSSGTLYGATARAGGSWDGAVFKVNTNGSGFTVLKTFAGNDGVSPGDLVVFESVLYGTASYDGLLGYGTVFQLNTDGGDFRVLKHFTGTDGSYPNGTLALSGKTLYGTAENGGGAADSGVLFSLSLLPGPPEIQLQPQSQTAHLHSEVSFVVVAGGIPAPAYQWFFNGNIIDFATNGLVKLPNVQGAQAGSYWVVVTNAYGSVTSVVATLTVEDPFINSQPGSQYVQAGAVVSFNVDAGGTAPLTFQWFKDGISLTDGGKVSGAQTTTLTLTNVSGGDAGWFSVLVTNIYGSITSAPAMLVVQDPFISDQPSDQMAGVGSVVTLSVGAGGTPPLGYQWFKNGGILGDGGNVSGAHTALLTLSNVLTGDSGGYCLAVTNVYGGLTSQVATLTVADPFITTQPVSQSVNAGTTAQFSLVANGTPPLSYQWFKNGSSLSDVANVSGAHTALLTLDTVFSDAGAYWVVVTNAYGSVTSQVAVLEVNLAFGDPFSPQPNSWVSCLALQADGKILAGGGFTSINGKPHTALALLNADGTLDDAFAPVFYPNAGVASLALQPDGQILAGGGFYVLGEPGGLVRTNIARFRHDGTLDATFNPAADGPVAALAVQSDGKILVGGSFNMLNGQPRASLGRLNPDGTLDTSFSPVFEGFVSCVGLQAEGKVLVVGEFSSLAGASYHNVVARFNTDGSLDTTFHPPAHPANSAAYALALQPDGKALVGGWPVFEEGGEIRAMLARLNPDGSLDLSFNANFDWSTSCVAVQSDGKILVGGGFSMVDGQPRDHIARLNADGTLDVAFNPSANDTVVSLLVQPDGAIVVGGGFTVLAGQARAYLGRLVCYGPPIVDVPPQSQNAEVGANVRFSVDVRGYPPPDYLWYFGDQPIAKSTNSVLDLTNVQFSDSGAFAVIVTNVMAAVTSPPAMLQVVAPVQRRPVPAIDLRGEAGSLLNLDYANSIAPMPNWLFLDTVSLTSASQFYFDITAPLPPQRFYRAWQTGTPSVSPALSLPGMAAALTLTGGIGDKVRLDAINQFGPIDAWFTLDTITLTNTSQLYFDATSIGQPPRLWRIVPVP